jgi:hypothetical protein
MKPQTKRVALAYANSGECKNPPALAEHRVGVRYRVLLDDRIAANDHHVSERAVVMAELSKGQTGCSFPEQRNRKLSRPCRLRFPI